MTARPKTARELGLMVGSPPPADKSVTLSNWEEPPYNRWGYLHVRDMVPTAKIPRGDGPVWKLPRAERDLMKTKVRIGNGRVPLARLLNDTYADGFLVLHRGRILTEEYRNDLAPDQTHLLMSVSKSITSTVAGVLIGRGQLSPDDMVTDRVPELQGTSWEGCTVRHLLDMRAGTRFNEDYADPDADVCTFEEIYGWRPRRTPELPDSMHEYYATLENQGPHGGPFDYRSILTDLLGWVIEKVAGARYADVVSETLWRPMGAEFDAEVTVDPHNHPMADGGVCCTLRDLARFGELMRRGGRRGSRKVVPKAWIRDTLTPDPDQHEAFRADPDEATYPETAYYRNKWWVMDASGPVYFGSGINGQRVLVHGPAEVVIAKFSTWPVAWSDDFAYPTRVGLIDLAEQIGDGLA